MVALIAQNTDIERRIDAAERQEIVRCNVYDPENIYWKNCDGLIEKQVEVTEQIANYTKDLKPVGMKYGD